jgi:hypothetical protein
MELDFVAHANRRLALISGVACRECLSPVCLTHSLHLEVFFLNNLNDAGGPDSFLAERRRIVDEIHSYTRQNMQMWVQWFTFFLTVNYVALGWFAGEIAKGELKDRTSLVYVGVLFIVQGILGIWVSLVWRKHLLKMKKDLSMAYDTLMPASAPTEFPHGAYGYAIALLVVIGVWVALVIRP